MFENVYKCFAKMQAINICRLMNGPLARTYNGVKIVQSINGVGTIRQTGKKVKLGHLLIP